MAKLVLIGGSGFFGYSFADFFNRNTFKKWGIDDLVLYARDIKKLEAIKDLFKNPGIHIISGNIQTEGSLPDADYYIYAANSTNLNNYINNPLEELDNATVGVRNFTDQLNKKNRQNKSLFTSSGAVYGSTRNNHNYPSESDDLLNNFTHNDPKITYAQGKIDSEKIFQTFASNVNKTSIARCFSFVGKFLPLDQHFAIGNFINDIRSEQAIKFNTKIRVYRSYLCADDLVEWLLEILLLSNNTCPIVNVGSEEEHMIHNLAVELAKLYNLDVNGRIDKYDQFDRYVPDITYAKKLGLKQSLSLLDFFKGYIKH
jgi:dTDP-glucose 4,6-dehydratase